MSPCYEPRDDMGQAALVKHHRRDPQFKWSRIS